MNGLKNKILFSAMLVMLLMGRHGLAQMRAAGPTIKQVDSAGLVLQSHPPDTAPIALRDSALKLIWEATEQCSANKFMKFIQIEALRTTLVDYYLKTPILWYFEQKTQYVIEQIKNHKPDSGIYVWQVYNMGYVVQTPSSCFAIDLVCHNSARFAPLIDFLLITHKHADHYTNELIDAMIAENKTVVTNWYPGTKLITQTTTLDIGDVKVWVHPGDHYRWIPSSQDDVLMYEIDCGKASQNIMIYHASGGTNYHKMFPENPIDVLITHVDLGNILEASNEIVRPRVTLISHVAELTQNRSSQGYRHSYQKAEKQRPKVKHGKAMVPAWGDKLVFKRGTGAL